MIHPLRKNARFLFVIQGCGHCAIYKKILPSINIKLPLGKQIEVIDCTLYDEMGILTDERIKLFESEIRDYPTLIFDGSVKRGAYSEEEVKAWLVSRLRRDFTFEEEPEFLESIGKYSTFESDCRWIKGRVHCQ